MQAANNKLYGITQDGGVNNLGILYEDDLVLNTLSIKHHFNVSDGNGVAQLTIGSNGILYGYGSEGGANK